MSYLPDDLSPSPTDSSTPVIDEEASAASNFHQPTYRGTASDPIFGFLLAVAVSIGLTPLLPDNAELRYTLAWAIPAGIGVLVWLLGMTERIGQETPENIIWGMVFGVILAIPFLIFGAGILETATRLIFLNMNEGMVLAYIVFVMPLSETLFFRGVMQFHLDWLLVGALATIWNSVLFFPVFWADAIAAPSVSLVIVVTLLIMNMLYGYVRERNSLAASWVTQLVVNLLMIFLPFL